MWASQKDWRKDKSLKQTLPILLSATLLRLTQPCPHHNQSGEALINLSFGKKICCLSAFIVKKYQVILVWNMCYDSTGRLPRDCLVAQRSFVAAGQLAPSAALHDLWNPWETSRASSTDGYQPPPHPLHSLWFPNQYFHRQFRIPAGPSVDVHSSSLCL